jgi:hypothetical protein
MCVPFLKYMASTATSAIPDLPCYWKAPQVPGYWFLIDIVIFDAMKTENVWSNVKIQVLEYSTCAYLVSWCWKICTTGRAPSPL